MTVKSYDDIQAKIEELNALLINEFNINSQVIKNFENFKIEFENSQIPF